MTALRTTLLRVDSTPADALFAHFQARKRPGSDLRGIEVNGTVAYLAVTTQGLTRAFVVTVAPVNLPEGNLLVFPPASEDTNPEPCEVTPSFLRLLSPAPLFLTGAAGTWRERAERHADRVRRSAAGDALLGTYGDARGRVGYDDAAKKAFEQDARRYLKRLGAHLPWPAVAGRKLVTYNPGGIAVSGEAMLRCQVDEDTELFVEVVASGLGGPRQAPSPSGVTVMWRFEGSGGGKRAKYFYPNQWARWDLPSAAFAAVILEFARFAQLPVVPVAAA